MVSCKEAMFSKGGTTKLIFYRQDIPAFLGTLTRFTKFLHGVWWNKNNENFQQNTCTCNYVGLPVKETQDTKFHLPLLRRYKCTCISTCNSTCKFTMFEMSEKLGNLQPKSLLGLFGGTAQRSTNMVHDECCVPLLQKQFQNATNPMHLSCLLQSEWLW